MGRKSKYKKGRRETSPLEARTPSPQAGAARLRLLGSLAVLAGLVVLAYFNSFRTEWQFDDHPNITENPYIRVQSLGPSSLWRAMVQDRQQNRPFSNLTFALNYYFNQTNIWGYHLVNLIWHLLATWAAFLALRLTFRRVGRPEPRSSWAALLAAAAWSVHPIQTQAVTYIVQRQTVMASALMLGSLAAYISGREALAQSRRRGFYLAAGLSLILAMGSKEIAIVTPVLILVYELYFFQNFSWAFLRRRAPYLVPALVLIFIIGAVGLGPAVWAQITSEYPKHHFTLGQRLLTEPRVLFQYLGLILLPLASQLSVEHDPLLSTSIFHPWTTLPAILLWLLLLAGAIRYARRFPLLSFALLWYLGNLFLESSFLPLDLMFEHRLYLPSLAVIGSLAAAPMLYLPRRRAVLVCLGLMTSLFLLDTLSRNQVWQTEVSLWRDCIHKTPRKARPYLNLGFAYLQKYEDDRAIAILGQAIQLDPAYAKAYYDRATAYFKQGQYDLAIADYSKALELNPEFIEAWNNRGIIYRNQGQMDRAFQDFNRALELDPASANAYFNRGNAYEMLGQADQALADYARGFMLDPSFVGDTKLLSIARQRRGMR